ncbi:MAG TPA: HD domain-containing protein [Bryobacteraceae bacterium]|jgi:3'-5' exoribonuclease|nr:HD domain-containing protein [Bryobacteraceae bacterium]
MKELYVGTLVPNEVATAQFLVLSKDIRQKKTGEPYLSLHLADRTGEIEAKMWDNVAEIMESFDRDNFVKVKGIVQIYQNRSQFTIHKLRRLQDHEVDPADYFPCSERDPEDMFRELRSVINGMGEPHLQTLLNAFFDDPDLAARYKRAPAAKSIHHAYRGGLLEHVLSLCGLCRLCAAHYPNLDLDLLLAGAILHDIGKIEELTYNRSFGYSAEGQLLGHIVIGLRMLGRKLDATPTFPPKLRSLLEHMLISHHGELEFGSPKVPIFPEALLLHHLDNLDSKMATMSAAVCRDQQNGAEFTGWIAPLERVVLRKAHYMAGPAAAAAKPETAAPVPEPEAPPAAPVSPPSPPQPAAEQPILVSPVQERKPPPNTLFGEKLQAVLRK